MKFSIVLPVFNGELYLDDCLSSLALQEDFLNEILVIDDASTDGTSDILTSWKTKLSTLKVITNSQNQGVSSARNHGIKAAISDWLIFVDADDCLSKDYSALVSQAITANPGACLIFGNYQQIDDEAKPFGNPICSPSLEKSSLKGQLLVRNFITSTSGVAVKRTVLGKGFNESLTLAEDWELWLRLAEQGEFIHLDEILVKLRRHQGNASRDVSEMQRAVKKVLQGLSSEEIDDAVNARNLAKDQNLADLVSIYQTRDDWSLAHSLLADGLREYPDSADLHFYLGVFHYHHMNYLEAISAFKACILHALGHLAAKNNLAICYLAENMIEEGREQLLQVTEENPDYLDASHNLARCEEGIPFDGDYKMTAKPLRSTLIKYLKS